MKALYYMATTRPVTTIFPSIRDMKACLSHSAFDPLFMTASVKNLSLEIKSFDGELLLWKAGEAAARMPAVQDLEIVSGLDAATAATCIVRLLDRFTSLSSLSIDRQAVNSSVIETASQLSKLHTLWIASNAISFYGRVNTLTPTLGHGSFPSLNTIVLDAALIDVIRLLEYPSFPSANIQRLTLYVVLCGEHILPESYISRFTTTLVNQATSLKKLRLYLDTNTRRYDPDLTRAPNVLFTTITPLLRARGLVRLSIHNATAIAMTDSDALSLAQALTELQGLILTRTAINAVPSQPTPTLRCLIHFAQYCQRLRHLELYLDATKDIPSPLEVIPFSNLHALHLGYSRIEVDSFPDIVRFLEGMLPGPDSLGVTSDNIAFAQPGRPVIKRDPLEIFHVWRKVVDGLFWLQEGKITRQ